MGNEQIRINVQNGYGNSLSNLVNALSESASADREQAWIEVVEAVPGMYRVVNDSLTVKGGDWIIDETALGFVAWDDEVEDLDTGNSDESQCFGMSSELRWNDVGLTPVEFRAPSIERLKEALSHVVVCAWCPGDI